MICITVERILEFQIVLTQLKIISTNNIKAKTDKTQRNTT